MSIKKTVAIVASAGVLVALALPALADTDVNVYGSIRASTAYDTIVLPKAGGNTTLFNLGNDATSRLGVNAKAGKLKINIELGVGDAEVYNTANGAFGSFNQTGWISSGGGLTAVYTRHAYGEYQFDAGKLLVGQTWSPYTVLSAQALNGDEANCYFGALYDGRLPQVKFTLNNGLYIAAIRQSNQETTAPATAGASTTLVGQNPVTSPSFKGQWLVPKLAIGYDGKTGNVSYGGGVLGQTYKDATSGLAVNSGMIYLHGKAVAGAFDALANVSVGLNDSGMGFKDGSGYLATGKTNVVTATALLGAGYTVSSSLKVNAGIGGGTSSSRATSATDVKPTLSYAAYVNTVVTLAKNVYITPEINYIDSLRMAAGNTGFRNYVYGAQWRMDF